MMSLNRIDDILTPDRKKIAVVGHTRPDGDCVGSCMGTWEYIRTNFDVQADVYLEPFPDKLDFLTEGKEINPERSKDYVYDVVFAMDCSDKERIGAGACYVDNAKLLVCIDHHVSNPGYGDINVIYPDYCSASEVVYTLMDREKLNKDTAVCLYTGIVHDSGVFQYSGVSPKTMQRAGELMEFGFDFSTIISSSIYEKKMTHQKLLGLALNRMELTADGNGVWSYVTLEDMEAVKSSPMETDGIAETLRNTRGIDYSVLFYETEPNEFKVSLRSKNTTNVSIVAVAFGGGGHVKASGCSFSNKTPNEMIELITKEIAKQKL